MAGAQGGSGCGVCARREVGAIAFRRASPAAASPSSARGEARLSVPGRAAATSWPSVAAGRRRGGETVGGRRQSVRAGNGLRQWVARQVGALEVRVGWRGVQGGAAAFRPRRGWWPQPFGRAVCGSSPSAARWVVAAAFQPRMVEAAAFRPRSEEGQQLFRPRIDGGSSLSAAFRGGCSSLSAALGWRARTGGGRG